MNDIELENGFTRQKSAVGSEIATAKTKMSANELKVFYQVSTLIDKDDDKFMKYTISVKDFIGSLGFSQTNIKDTKDICRTLAKQCFEIQEGDIWKIYPIFSGFELDTKAQMISFEFNDKMKPYLLNLKNFTKIENVEYIKKFDSKHAIRIYALLKDYRKMSYRDIDIEALKKILALEPRKTTKLKTEDNKPKKKTYDNYNNIKKKVLEPAMREINEKSDLYISEIEEIKKERRKVLKIRIHFGDKSERIANEKIKYLIDFYYRNRGDFAFKAFYGMYYINPLLTPKENRTIKDLKKITSIEIDHSSKYHQLFCDNNQDNSILGSPNAKDFLKALCTGIHEAILIYYENNKKNKLDLKNWQSEQDEKKAQEQKIEEYKDILRAWLGAKKEE